MSFSDPTPSDAGEEREDELGGEELSEEDEVPGEAGEEERRQVRAPWHFKVIAVGSVVYLGYRAYQGITWLVHHV